jgi:hypothetical protein
MKNFLLIILMNVFMAPGWAQNGNPDSVVIGTVTVSKDLRIETLGRKMTEYNESLAKKNRSTRGYRLMLLTTNDREKAIKVRTQLLQRFPDQSIYMVFQSPFIKLKMGNFQDRGEATDIRRQVMAAKIITGNIYIIPELIEVKAEKFIQSDDQ